MSPAHNDHSFAKSSVHNALPRKMPMGKVLQGTVIDTEDGNKVTDGVWMSVTFYRVHKGQPSFKHAPEICVEVLSPGNSMRELLEKKDLCFKAGAVGVWIRDASGKMRFFDADGPLKRSALCPTFPLTVKI